MRTVIESVPGLRLTPAGGAELDVVYQVIDGCARWLHARGVTGQWPAPFPRELVERWADSGTLFLARIDAEPAGTIRLEWQDQSVWPECGEQGGPAGYVHTLTVARRFAGTGLGAVLLDWAADQVRAAGRQLLRLDCWAGNAMLADYYRRQGFDEIDVVGEELGEDRWLVRRFERPV